ncbi:MAG: hypothetical protein E6I18_05985 [Chloroflexi bacterium]|nr:MAG: hypothetical protein E6I18_05985 [Chloroflexota bacterium]
MNPPLRTVGAIAVAAALLAQTWLWIGVMAPPIGYTVDDRVSTLTDTQFFLGGFPGDLSPSGNMTIRADAHHFEQDWPLTNGGAVHISEDIPPYAILFGGGLSHDELIAAFHTRAKWKEGTALGGRANALRATIGRVSVSIEAPLSYEDLFRIAESLRPGFAPL